MKNYNIPNDYLVDIATCGISPKKSTRLSIWRSWSERQREAALTGFEPVLEALAEFNEICEESQELIGLKSPMNNNMTVTFHIDLSKPYSMEEMLQAIEQTIKEEEQVIKDAVEQAYDDCYLGND